MKIALSVLLLASVIVIPEASAWVGVFSQSTQGVAKPVFQPYGGGQSNETSTTTVCNPNDPSQYSLLASLYKVGITASTDKPSYFAGDVMTITGNVTLQQQNEYYDPFCGSYAYGSWQTIPAANTMVTLQQTSQTVTPASEGSFSFTETISPTIGCTTCAYTLVATHEPGGETASTNVTFMVAPSPNFAISASPMNVSVEYGKGASFSIVVQSENNFHEPVTLSIAPVQGVTTSLSITQGVPDYHSTLSLSVDSSTAAGTYLVKVVGTSGTLTRSVSLTVIVVADFSVGATSVASVNVTVTQGSRNSTSIILTSYGGFHSSVALSSSWVGPQPTGVTVSLPASESLAPGQDVIIPVNISVLPNATVGTFVLMISVSTYQDPHSVQLFVHVAAAPSNLTWLYLAAAGVVVAAAAVTTQQVRKKNQKQPKQNIIWTVTAPPKIRKGGRTYAHITLTNSGMVPISNATITIVAPHDFRTDPIIRLEPLAPNQTTYVPLRIGSVQNAAIGKKTISLTLNTGQTAPQIRPLILSVQTLRVGLLLDSHNQSYTQHLSSALSDPFRPWLEKHHYEYETITESSLSNTQKYNVVLAPNQYALTNQDIDALRTYTNSGGGLVALGSIGIIDADKPLASGDAAVKVSRISEVLGYQSGETSEVERCYGIRMVQGEHPISKGEKMDQVNQIQFRGSVYVKPVTTGTLIAEERVRLSSGDLVIPAIVANQYGKGRAVHFNINPSESMNALDSLIEKAVDWAANFL